MWRKLIYHTCFLHKAHHSITAFLGLGTLIHTSAHHSRAILRSKFIPPIPPHSLPQKWGCDTKQTVKRTVVYIMRAETRKQSVALFDVSWGYSCWGGLKFFCFPEHVCEWPQKCCEWLILRLQINFSKFVNMKSMNNKDQLYILDSKNLFFSQF